MQFFVKAAPLKSSEEHHPIALRVPVTKNGITTSKEPLQIKIKTHTVDPKVESTERLRLATEQLNQQHYSLALRTCMSMLVDAEQSEMRQGALDIIAQLCNDWDLKCEQVHTRDIAAKEAVLVDLSASLARVEYRCSSLSGDARRGEEECSNLTSALARAEDRCTSLLDDVRKGEAECSSLSVALARAEDRCSSLSEERCSNLLEQLKSRTRNAINLRKSPEILDAEERSLSMQLASSEQNCEVLEQRLASCREMLEVERQALARQGDLLEEMSEACHHWEESQHSQCEQLRNEELECCSLLQKLAQASSEKSSEWLQQQLIDCNEALRAEKQVFTMHRRRSEEESHANDAMRELSEKRERGLQKQLASSDQTNEMLQRQLVDCKEALGAEKQAFAMHMGRSEEESHAMRDLSKKFRVCQEDNRELQMKADKFSHERHILSEELWSEQTEVEKTARLKERLKTHEREVGIEAQALMESKKNNESLQRQLVGCNEGLAAERQAFVREVGAEAQALIKSKENHELLQRQLAGCNEGLAAERQAFARREEELDAAMQDLSEKLRLCQEDNRELQMKADRVGDERHILSEELWSVKNAEQTEVEETARLKVRLKNNFWESGIEAQALMESKKNNESLQRQLVGCNEELVAESKKNHELLQRQLAGHNEELDAAMQDQSEKLRLCQEDNRELRWTECELQVKVDKFASDGRTLSERLRELEKEEQVEIEEALRLKVRLKKSERQAEVEVQALKIGLRAAQEEAENAGQVATQALQDERAAAQDSSQGVKRKLRAAETDGRLQRVKIADLEADIASKEARLTTLSSENEKLKQKAKRLEELNAQNKLLKAQVKEVESLKEENVELKKKLRQSQRRPTSPPTSPVPGGPRPPRSPIITAKGASMAQEVAELECKPLLSAHEPEKMALKKKLLLKWHPDRQPSPGHASFATQVMQEMQARPEWAKC